MAMQYVEVAADIREFVGNCVKISEIERAHGVKFENRAFDFAISISGHRDRLEILKEERIRDRLIDVLNKAAEYKAKGGNNQILVKELERRQYILRRALLEYNQILKDNAAAADSSLSMVETLVAEELEEAFFELVKFMSKTMYINHDDFVSAVHDKDYSQILDQIDAKIHDNFKHNQTVDCPEIAKIGFDLTGVPASWLHRNEKLLMRVFQKTRVLEAMVPLPWSSKGLSLLTGPNNVSKKELISATAVFRYYDEDRLVRFDMEEYKESDSASSLVDSIASTMNTRPFTVLVFDKIEKAHPCVVHTLCMCVRGRTGGIDFEKNMIIITSDLDVVELGKSVGSSNLCEMAGDVIEVEWPCDLKDCCRIMMRAWGLGRSKPVVICPSKAALIQMETDAAAGGDATMEGLERWMEEKVFSVLSKMVLEYDGIAASTIIYIDTEETGELSFNFG